MSQMKVEESVKLIVASWSKLDFRTPLIFGDKTYTTTETDKDEFCLKSKIYL